jgi:hypothetical protein
VLSCRRVSVDTIEAALPHADCPAVCGALEIPVRIRGEPVVVTAVEDHGVVVGNTAIGQQLGELLGVDEVPHDGVLELGAPVQLDHALDVPAVIGAGVLVDLDEDDVRRVEIAVVGEFKRSCYPCGAVDAGLSGRAAVGELSPVRRGALLRGAS